MRDEDGLELCAPRYAHRAFRSRCRGPLLQVVRRPTAVVRRITEVQVEESTTKVGHESAVLGRAMVKCSEDDGLRVRHSHGREAGRTERGTENALPPVGDDRSG
jgi:hypothetical protein